jgi:hypothetical protein
MPRPYAPYPIDPSCQIAASFSRPSADWHARGADEVPGTQDTADHRGPLETTRCHESPRATREPPASRDPDATRSSGHWKHFHGTEGHCRMVSEGLRWKNPTPPGD